MERGNKRNEILRFLLVMKGLTQWNKWNSLSRNMKKTLSRATRGF